MWVDFPNDLNYPLAGSKTNNSELCVYVFLVLALPPKTGASSAKDNGVLT
jgi:hypothetical protein